MEVCRADCLLPTSVSLHWSLLQSQGRFLCHAQTRLDVLRTNMPQEQPSTVTAGNWYRNTWPHLPSFILLTYKMGPRECFNRSLPHGVAVEEKRGNTGFLYLFICFNLQSEGDGACCSA